MTLSRRAFVAGTAAAIAAPTAAFASPELSSPSSLFELLAGGLLADGRIVPRVTYANLYAIIGDRFGGYHDGLPDWLFVLPDIRPTLVETGEKFWDGEHRIVIYTGDASLWNWQGDQFWKMPISVWDLSV